MSIRATTVNSFTVLSDAVAFAVKSLPRLDILIEANDVKRLEARQPSGQAEH